jgi:hypothetical protein
MRKHPSERYSAELCQGVQDTLRTFSLPDLHALLPGMRLRGGPGLTLLRLELRRRPPLVLD